MLKLKYVQKGVIRIIDILDHKCMSEKHSVSR